MLSAKLGLKVLALSGVSVVEVLSDNPICIYHCSRLKSMGRFSLSSFGCREQKNGLLHVTGL